MSPFVTGMSFRTGVAALPSEGTWYFNPRMDGKSCSMSMKSNMVNFPLYSQVRLILPLGVI